MESIRNLFDAPDRRYRPWTYWWWPGATILEKDVAPKLDEMVSHGIGGAVIVPVYAVDDSRPSLEAFSPEFNKLVALTLKEAKKRDLAIWLNIGGGRLPGGPFVTEETSVKRLAARSQRLRGPRRIDTDIWLWAAKTHQSRLRKDVAPFLSLDSIHLLHRDERNRVRERVFIDNPPQRGVRWIWSLEKGIFDLIVCFTYPTGQLVDHASPGWEGFVLDPYDAEATRAFIDRTIEAFGDTGDKFLESSFRGWLLEGFEAPGANFTPSLFEEFEKRRGYDLRRRLPDLWDNLDKDSEGVRQDMLRTLAELQEQNFYLPLIEAIEKRGQQLMLQPQGATADVMRLASRVAVPMGETAGPRTYEKYIDARGRRFASSIARHYDKPLVPAECYTRLHQSRFCISLELMKAASDTIYLGGVNHLCNHGLTYSPSDLEGEPWIYCEPTLVGPPQTWWDYYPELSNYVSRLNLLFQKTKPHVDVLMYAPLADSFARTLESIPLKRGLDNTWGQKLTGEPGIDTGAAMGRHTLPCADPIEEAGYRFDYINGETLVNKAQCVDGDYVVGDFRYRIMVFHRVGYLPLPVLRRLRELIEAGCKLVAVGRTPMGLFGKAETDANEKEFNDLIGALYPKGKGKNRQRQVGKGVVFEVETPVDLVELLNERFGPDLVSEPFEPNLGFAHQVKDGRHFYFVANCSQKNRSLSVGLRIGRGAVERWNAETGKREPWALTRQRDDRLWVDLEFSPYESHVLLVDPEAEGPPSVEEHNFDEIRVSEDGKTLGWSSGSGERFAVVNGERRFFRIDTEAETFRVPGPWRVEFPEPVSRTLVEKKLKCWTKSSKTRHFSGTAKYSTKFEYETPPEGARLHLDLGRLHDVAEAWINGHRLGVTWKPPRVLDIPQGVLKQGENTLEVAVCNMGHNAHLLDEADARFEPRPGYGQTRAVRGVKKPVPLSAGLLGPVRIRAYVSVEIA